MRWILDHWFVIFFSAGQIWVLLFGRHYSFTKHDNLYDFLYSVTVQPWKEWIYARRERRWLARQPKPDGSPFRG